MAGNKNLQTASKAKKDEFYTQLVDIENELRHYKEHFKGKTIFCNCDDPRVSNFFKYFAFNFEFFGLKRLIATCYKNQDIDLFSENKSEKAVYLIYNGDKNGNHIVDNDEKDVKELNGDGDFRSKECVDLLKRYCVSSLSQCPSDALCHTQLGLHVVIAGIQLEGCGDALCLIVGAEPTGIFLHTL